MDLGLSDKKALVLCSSQGLGFGIAQALAAEKAQVAILARHKEKLTALASQLSKIYNTRVIPIACDLSDVDSVSIIQHEIEKNFSGIDILINSSGGPPLKKITDISTEMWKKSFDEILLRIITLTNLFLPRMYAKKWGRILSIISSGAIQPIKDLGISNTLRSSIIAWSKTLANEVASSGITVNTIIPGRIHTERVDQIDTFIAENMNQTKEMIVKKSISNIPIGRYGTVEEFAAVATFLVSEKASYITGSSIRVDGGLISSI